MAQQPLWQALLAGACGGVLQTVVGHPLDTFKVSHLGGGVIIKCRYAISTERAHYIHTIIAAVEHVEVSISA
jgi:hypothetical protein